jgi:hypothetical protein
MPFLLTFVPEGLRRRVHTISIQQVVDVFKREESLTWVGEFERKYGLNERNIIRKHGQIAV